MGAKEFVKKILEETVFTQQQIADCMGVDQSLVSKWKTGERELTAQQFDKLCGVLGYSLIDYLEGRTHQPISIAFSAKALTNDDVVALGRLNHMFANLKYMETLDSYETD